MDSDDERDDLEELIAEFSAEDPAFPAALAAAEERLAIMTRLKAAQPRSECVSRLRPPRRGHLARLLDVAQPQPLWGRATAFTCVLRLHSSTPCRTRTCDLRA